MKSHTHTRLVLPAEFTRSYGEAQLIEASAWNTVAIFLQLIQIWGLEWGFLCVLPAYVLRGWSIRAKSSHPLPSHTVKGSVSLSYVVLRPSESGTRVLARKEKSLELAL